MERIGGFFSWLTFLVTKTEGKCLWIFWWTKMAGCFTRVCLMITGVLTLKVYSVAVWWGFWYQKKGEKQTGNCGNSHSVPFIVHFTFNDATVLDSWYKTRNPDINLPGFVLWSSMFVWLNCRIHICELDCPESSVRKAYSHLRKKTSWNICI